VSERTGRLTTILNEQDEGRDSKTSKRNMSGMGKGSHRKLPITGEQGLQELPKLEPTTR